MILFGVDQATELACPVDTPSFYPVSSEKAVLIFCKKKKTVGLGVSICESTSSSFIYKRDRDGEKNLQKKKDSVPTEVPGIGKYSPISPPLSLDGNAASPTFSGESD